MNPLARDAALATLCGAALVAALAISGSLSALFEPASAAAGVAVALAVEALFVFDTPASDLWERPAVRVGSAVALATGGALALAAGGPRVVAALCWGLGTYFALLALLLAGIWTPDDR
ncbi:MAG: hypothetical protein ABEJ26_05110 [Halosimplex sp.]